MEHGRLSGRDVAPAHCGKRQHTCVIVVCQYNNCDNPLFRNWMISRRDADAFVTQRKRMGGLQTRPYLLGPTEAEEYDCSLARAAHADAQIRSFACSRGPS